jgi:hypothetical protein
MRVCIEPDGLKQSEPSALNVFNRIGQTILCHLLPQSPEQAPKSRHRSADMISPHIVEDFLVGEDAGGAGPKLFEKFHLTVREGNWLFVDKENARLPIQSEVTDRYATLGLSGQGKIALAAAKVCMKTGQKEGDGSFLDDVIVGSSIERSGLI